MARIKMDMTKGKIVPQLLLFALPIMVTSVIHQLFNTADTIVVGRWGGATPEAREIALSAVGACGPLNSLLITLFMGLSVGAGVVVSHAVGAKHYEQIKKTVHTSITLATLCGVLLSVIGFVFARPLLAWLDTPDAIMDQAVLYMRAYFCGIPAQLIYNYCASMLRSIGDSTRPLIFLSVSGVVNIVLNLIMVLVFEQGALGVGIATAASQWVACIMVLVYMARDDGLCRFEWKSLGLDSASMKKILSIGIPAGVQSSMFAIGNVVMQSALNSFNSTVYVSGSSIASNLGTYPQLLVGAFEQSAQVFVGQNTGAKNMKRIRKGITVSALMILISAVALNTVMNLFSQPLLEIFSPGNAAVVEFAQIKLLVNSSFYFLAHLGNLYAGSIRGMGNSTIPMIVSVAGICGVRILWIYTVFVWIRHPLTIFFAYGVSWFITYVAQFILYRSVRKKKEKQWEAERISASASPIA